MYNLKLSWDENKKWNRKWSNSREILISSKVFYIIISSTGRKTKYRPINFLAKTIRYVDEKLSELNLKLVNAYRKQFEHAANIFYRAISLVSLIRSSRRVLWLWSFNELLSFNLDYNRVWCRRLRPTAVPSQYLTKSLVKNSRNFVYVLGSINTHNYEAIAARHQPFSPSLKNTRTTFSAIQKSKTVQFSPFP